MVRWQCAALLQILSVVLLVLSASAGHAQGYLDPGSGSYILQALASLFIVGVFVLRGYWQKLKVKFQRHTAKDPAEQPDE